jgi:hypothetical protein
MYIAINGEELVSAHRTYEGALVALMRYVGFTEKEIKKMRKDGIDITMTDSVYQVVETVR